MIGQTISHYKITAKLGSGGMGEVYLAEDTDLKRKVALKFLLEADSATHEIATRFRHEAQAAAALSHPNIATVHEVSEHEGRPYIVMEYIDGPTLSKYCQAEETAIDEILDLAIQIGEGLKKAHAAGIVHRDLKPANILVDQDRRPKILDFGLAKLKGATKVTKTGSTLGTAAYMSPEQGAGQDVDHRTDIWSLGVILYEMIARRLPFDAEHEAAVTYAIANDTPHPLARYCADVPDQLQRIVIKCLAKRPSERYQTAADLVADLQTLRRTTTGRVPGDISRRKRLKSVLIPVAAVAILVLAVWGGLQLRRWLSPAKASAKSLAVVDFNNVGAEEDAYLASGLAEDLAVKLRRLAGFKVASSADIRRLTRENLLPREVATRLNVQYALGGSLLRQGDLVRVNVDLIDKESGDVVWSDQIDKQFTEIFQFLDEVSLRIAQALEVRLTPVEQAAIAAKPTDDTEAYDHYLKGRHYYYNLTFQDNELAEKEFEKALQGDPDYPLALAGLADTYVQRYKEAFDQDEFWLDSADVLVERSLALDPALAEAYESRAEAQLQKDNITGAFEAAERARALRPDWDEPYVHLGNIYQKRGERSKALAMFDTALSLRPSVDALCGKGNVFENRGLLDSAQAVYQAASELNPYHNLPYLELGWLYQRLSQQEKAEGLFRRAIDVRPDRDDGYYHLSWTLYDRGRVQEGEDILREFVTRHPYNMGGYSSLYTYLADVRGDYAAAFQTIEDAVSRNPEQTWPHLLLAYSYAEGMSPELQSGDALSFSQKAVQAIDRALAMRPNSGRVLEWAGKVYASLKRINEAVHYFDRAVQARKGSSDLLKDIGLALIVAKQYEKAVVYLRMAVAESPGNAGSYYYLQAAMHNLNRWEESFGIVSEAAGRYGDDLQFLALLSDEQRLAGLFGEAVNTAQRISATKRSNYFLSRPALGLALWLSGDVDRALEVLQEEEYFPDPLLWVVPILKSEGRFGEIDTYLASFKEETPTRVSGIDLWSDLASGYYFSMRRFDDVLAVLEEERKSGEQTFSTDNTLIIARCYRQKGELNSANRILKELADKTVGADRSKVLIEQARLLAIGAADLAVPLGLAEGASVEPVGPENQTIDLLLRLAYASGRTDPVARTLEQLPAVYMPFSAQAFYRKPQIAEVTGLDDARSYLDNAISSLTRLARCFKVPGEIGEASAFLSLALARAGRPDEAAREVKRALKLEPEREDIAYLAACAYSLMGDTTLALRWLKTAVERGYLELWWARVDPDLDPLRKLPRFKQIMDDWDRRIQALLERETR